MRKVVLLLLYAAISVGLVACSDSDDDKFTPEIALENVEQANIQFSAVPSSKSKEVNIKSNTDWTVEVSATGTGWLTATPDKGEGDGKVTITVANNDDENAKLREGTVTVYCTNYTSQKVTINVKQTEYVVDFSIVDLQDEYVVKSAGETLDLTLNSTAPWEVEIKEVKLTWKMLQDENGANLGMGYDTMYVDVDEDFWLKVNPVSGPALTESQDISLEIPSNSTDFAKRAKVFIRGTEENDTEEISFLIKQETDFEGYMELADGEKLEYDLSYEGGQIIVNVKSNIEWTAHRAGEAPTLIDFPEGTSSGTFGKIFEGAPSETGTELKIDVLENPFDGVSKALVKIYNKDYQVDHRDAELEIEITIDARPYIKITPSTLDHSFNTTGGTVTLSIESYNIQYDVYTDSPAWLKVPSKNYGGDYGIKETKEFVITVLDNNTGETRNGTITINDPTNKVESIDINFTVYDIVDEIITFGDPVLKNALMRYDENGDGEISSVEALKVTSLTIDNNTEFTSLEGIRYLKNLRVLQAMRNNIEDADLSGLTKLEEVFLNYQIGGLKSINLDGCTSLKILNINGADLDSDGNGGSLDLTGTPNLESLGASSCGLWEIKGLSNLKKINEIHADGNAFTRFFASNLTTLNVLNLSNNDIMGNQFSIDGCTNLGTLNLMNNPDFGGIYFDWFDLPIRTLNLRGNTKKFDIENIDESSLILVNSNTIVVQNTFSADENPVRKFETREELEKWLESLM